MEIVYKKGHPFRKETLNLMEKVKTSESIIFVPIEKEVLWFRESESTVILTYKDKVVKNYTTFNDYYGYLFSIKSAIDEANSLEEHYQVELKSGLVFKVLNSIIETPVLINPDQSNIQKSYLEVPSNWYQIDELTLKRYQDNLKSKDFKARAESYSIIEQFLLTSKTIYEEQEVWSSGDKRDFELIKNNLK